jgi:hypothetical protein
MTDIQTPAISPNGQVRHVGSLLVGSQRRSLGGFEKNHTMTETEGQGTPRAAGRARWADYVSGVGILLLLINTFAAGNTSVAALGVGLCIVGVSLRL